MSIAAISSNFVSAVRGSLDMPPVEPVQGARAVHRQAQGEGRRHELIGAMNQALGNVDEQGKETAQAVFRFAHALMHELRSVDAGGEQGPARGHAWGRREWSDLPQRIDALATAVGAQAGQAQAPAAPAVAAAAVAAVADVSVVAEPPMPKPLTRTSAAVYMMQVPSSRLIAAYEALHQAMGSQPVATTAAGAREGLAALLERLSSQLAPDTASAVPAGSVLDVTA